MGTAGALPALHQDVSAPGVGWEIDSSSAQVTTARFFLVKIRVGHYLAICLPQFLDQLIDLASFGHFPVECHCILGSLSFTDIVQVNLQRNMMPKLRLLAKQMAAEFRVEESVSLGLGT